MSRLVFWLAENILLFAGFNEAPSVDVMVRSSYSNVGSFILML